MFKSLGFKANSLIFPSLSLTTSVFAYGEISSSPSWLFTINAFFEFKFLSASAKTLSNFLSKTPTTCLFTFAGLLNGPIKLNIVFFPIFFYNWPNVFHGRMITWSKHKSKIIVAYTCFHFFRPEINIDI